MKTSTSSPEPAAPAASAPIENQKSNIEILQPLPTPAQAIKPNRRRRGKIARLPRKIREEINLMLDDGLPHADIIARLGDHGKNLNRQNLINWQQGGFKDWLKDQPWLDQLHSSLDFAANILDDSDAPKLREASLIIAVRQMYDLIKSFEPADFMQQLAEDPAAYSRILNSLAKLAEVGLRYDRERAEATRAEKRESNRSKKAAGLTEDMLRQYENEFKLLRRPAQPSHGNVSLRKPAPLPEPETSKPNPA
jgi:hypothetical protein